MPGYRHLFFDLDRTLWDLDKNARETLGELYKKYQLGQRGVESEEIFIDHYNRYNDLLWDRYRRKIIDKATLRALRFKQALAHFGVHDPILSEKIDHDYLSEAPKKRNLVPGAKEVIETLHARFKLHIITNGFPEVQRHKICHSGLEKYFDVILTSEECGYAKPDRRIFRHALKKCGGKAGEALMIGDDLEVDIVGAREAGWHQVFFNPAKGSHKEKVTYEISHLDQLKVIVGS
ncbi:MAG TPA: YjjG family noncanonical pyrimidine nucleotidase [Bacteroidia bacterium]|nr:YjjG family noncanonical pyrimidine nucleotidase [Bacteroidia bacterium]